MQINNPNISSSLNQAVITPVLKADLTASTYSYYKSTNRFPLSSWIAAVCQDAKKSVYRFLKIFEKQCISFAKSTQWRHCSVRIKGFWDTISSTQPNVTVLNECQLRNAAQGTSPDALYYYYYYYWGLLRDVRFLFCWGWGGCPFFSPAHFTYVTSLMPTTVSGRNYGNKFTASMGAYTMMDLMIP